MAIMEGMSYGMVPVTTAVGGIPYHIQDKENGILIKNSLDEVIIQQFVQAVENLDKNRSKLKEMSHASYKYASQHFDKQLFIRKYQKLFTY